MPHAMLDELLVQLSAPKNLYIGANAHVDALPREIVPFARTSAREAFDGGPHMHSRFVFCYCLKSGASLAVDNDLLSITPGQAILLFPFEKHQFHQFENPDILWLFIGFDLADSSLLNYLRHYVCQISTPLKSRLTEVVTHAIAGSQGEPSSSLHASANLLSILSELNLTAKNQPKTTDLQSGHPIVRGVLREIHQPGGMNTTIYELADKLHVSEVHLRRTFRDTTGIALGSFIRSMRIKLAQSLLSQGSLRISEIADLCGFNNLYSFSRAFTRDVGMSAQEYRAKRAAGTLPNVQPASFSHPPQA